MGLLNLLERHAIIQYGEFTLKSGKKSDVYVDLKKATSIPGVFAEIVEQLINVFTGNETALVCGVPTGGVPYASALAYRLSVPLIAVRETVKEHGTQKQIEGEYKMGQSVFLVEDVVTTGGSLSRYVEILKRYGLNVFTVCIVNRGDYDCPSLVHLKVTSLKRKFVNNHSTKLWRFMHEKQSNLCYSVDSPKAVKILPQIIHTLCLVKVHWNMLGDWDCYPVEEECKKNDVMILNDAKVADIGNTVSKSDYGNGQFITMHSLFGFKSIEGMKNRFQIFLVAESSSKNSLITPEYTEKTYELGKEHGVAGFVCQNPRDKDPRFLYITPGVRKSVTGDDLGQTYRTPEVVVRGGSDIIIVGRGITDAEDPVKAAEEYRLEGWSAMSV